MSIERKEIERAVKKAVLRRMAKEHCLDHVPAAQRHTITFQKNPRKPTFSWNESLSALGIEGVGVGDLYQTLRRQSIHCVLELHVKLWQTNLK